MFTLCFLLYQTEVEALGFQKVPVPADLVRAFWIAAAFVVIQIILARLGVKNRSDEPRFRYWLGWLLLVSALSYVVGEVYHGIIAAWSWQVIKVTENFCGPSCVAEEMSLLYQIRAVLNLASCVSVALSLLVWAQRRPKAA